MHGIWLPPRDSNPDMLIQRETNIDVSPVPQCFPKFTESYVSSFLSISYASNWRRRVTSGNKQIRAGIRVINIQIGTTRWYD